MLESSKAGNHEGPFESPNILIVVFYVEHCRKMGHAILSVNES